MRARAALAAALALLFAALVSAAGAATIDPEASEIGFTLRTRWGKTLEGRFPRYTGEIATLPDGRHQVRLRLSTRDVEIVDSPTYTRITRGEGFFDAGHFPLIEFVSDAYAPALVREGGRLGGQLTIRGVQRREAFTIQPARCGQPAIECDVIASGAVDRGHYGLNRWGFALSSRVVFQLRIRVLAAGEA